MKAEKAKHCKMEAVLALINPLYISSRNGPFLATCGGGGGRGKGKRVKLNGKKGYRVGRTGYRVKKS